ncbi:MAG: BREX system ATP-binding protein BrxD [Acidobacteria bacterium]|nr:MAG: BREX system ATP-binding protein BrxD [Acidobacteriota bacterium]REK10064.1 MAG: BREX system ATP-binding protein BrxD [Acidobacteriota bacterium]
MSTISPQRRGEVLSALRRGTVPQHSLGDLAVGLQPFEATLEDELGQVERGAAHFKAVRGEYGSGKTFLARWFQESARRRGFATSEVQVSETETPLHRLETVYRRLIERLATAESLQGSLRLIVDGWFYTLENDVISKGEADEDDAEALHAATAALMEHRLAAVTRTAPALAAGLRGYREALLEGDAATAEGLLAWMSGQPTVGASVKRQAGLTGKIDHFGALSFLQGWLVILRDSGYKGLVLVLDEVETLQRVRSDVRDKGLNALRQLLDEVDGGRFPGLYLMITGTPAFFDGPQGIQRLAPLAQRLQVDFSADARFDNPRAVQIRLRNFDLERLVELAKRVRDLYASHCAHQERLHDLADDRYLEELARAIVGELGGKVGIAPRIFLRKLVTEVLDRIDQFDDFDPRQHYSLTVSTTELTVQERAASGRLLGDEGDGPERSVDDIDLDL